MPAQTANTDMPFDGVGVAAQIVASAGPYDPAAFQYQRHFAELEGEFKALLDQ